MRMLFTDLLPTEAFQKVAAFDVSSGLSNEDQLVFIGSPNEKLSIKSTIAFIQCNNHEEEDNFWGLI